MMTGTKSILLIEDNTHDSEYIKQGLLSSGNCQVEMTQSSEHALELLTSETRESLPDIILLGINLPKTNGYDFLQIIKIYYSFINIKVYVLGNSSEEYDRQRSLLLGAEEYFIKPTEPEKKVELVENLQNVIFGQS